MIECGFAIASVVRLASHVRKSPESVPKLEQQTGVPSALFRVLTNPLAGRKDLKCPPIAMGGIKSYPIRVNRGSSGLTGAGAFIIFSATTSRH